MTKRRHKDRPPDVPRLLEPMDAHQVRYVLIGSVAAQLYGIEAQPGDLDVTPALDQENLTRLARLLLEIEASLTDELGHWEIQPDGERKWISEEPTPEALRERAEWVPDPENVSTFDHLFHTRYGNFDVVPNLTGDYEALIKRAKKMRAHGREIRVAHVDELLSALTVLRRKKDIPRVRQLREIQRQLD